MGLFDKLKLAFGVTSAVAPDAASSSAPTSEFAKEFTQSIADTKKEWAKENRYFHDIKVDKLAAFAVTKEWPDKKRVLFVEHCAKVAHEFHKKGGRPSSSDSEYGDSAVCGAYISHLLKMKWELRDEDLQAIHTAFAAYPKWSYQSWPIGLLVGQVEKQLKHRALSVELRKTLLDLQEMLGSKADVAKAKDLHKISARVDEILFRADADKDAVLPVAFQGKDAFGVFASQQMSSLSVEENAHWSRAITLARQVSGSKPTTKFLAASKELIETMGADRFKNIVHTWFDHVARMKEVTEEHSQVFRGRTYITTSHTFLVGPDQDMLKGLAWMCSHFHDGRTIAIVAAVAERSFRKIPGQGPAAASLGNACLYSLFRSKGLDGIGQLSRLRLRIKQSSTVALIDRYLAEAAKAKGISVHEIEDLACDDHGLKNGVRSWAFDEYTATLTINGPSRSELAWTKPDGTPQKSVPKVVKEKHAAKLKRMKEVVKQVDLTTMAQRDRLDRMFRAQRELQLDYFNTHFLHHGLLGSLARLIIWNFRKGDVVQPAICLEGDAWTTVGGTPFEPSTEMTVSLWHPALASVAEVKAWREYMLDKEIRQPLKQAFREVYLLTEAELNTRTYSNRMAAHLLKQHQFNSLAKTRGWRYALQGAFDNGQIGEGASISLPDHGIQAEFWLNEVGADGALNDTGIWTYVASDQLRFTKMGSVDPMELVDVPTLAFSEVMRDVDLFVGVASVGNDPQWHDRGGEVPGYNDYWQTYSFGDLGEVAKTRKEILTRLLPRLKIAPVCSIHDKFLVVKGTLRTYKIHMGSTNILMEPNDQYLCIVPDRSKASNTPSLFLPFEGDSGLSVIISKAFLLAADTKITDPTIISQISRA